MSVLNGFKSSFMLFKDLRTMVFAALMSGISIVMNMFFRLDIGMDLRISFGFLAVAVGAYMCGPAVGMVIGGLSEILSYIIKPTGPFFPGFTVTAILTAMVFGIFLYQKKVSIVSCIVSKLTVNVILNAGLNTIWLSILYGDGFFVMMPARLLKNLILLPIEVAILYFVIKSADLVIKRSGFGQR